MDFGKNKDEMIRCDNEKKMKSRWKLFYNFFFTEEHDQKSIII